MDKSAFVHFQFEIYSDNMSDCSRGMLDATGMDINQAAEWLERKMAANPRAEYGEIRLVLMGMPVERRCVIQAMSEGGAI